MQPTLIRFLKTGELGPLNCGLFREDVRQFLGDPPYWDGREAFSERWWYEALCVDFSDDHRVIGYGLGFNPGQRIPDGLGDMAGRHYLEITMEEIREVLNLNAIPFEVGKGADSLRTAAGVWILGWRGKLMNILYECPGLNRVTWLDERMRRPQTRD